MVNFFPVFCSMSCLFFLFLARAGWTGLDWVLSAASRFCCNEYLHIIIFFRAFLSTIARRCQ